PRALPQLDRTTARAAHAERRKTPIVWQQNRFARASRHREADKRRPIFTFDAGYEPVQLGVALAGLDVSILVRLRSGRCLYADPPAGRTGGRPRRHGAMFVGDDPTTWPQPTREWRTPDTQDGWVRIHCWSGLHAIPPMHDKRGTRQARPIVR